MPRNRRGKSYLPAQRQGTEFGGNVQQNGVQPRHNWDDLSPKEQAQLIKTTGQDSDPSAIARPRHFQGQAGKPPKNYDLL